MKRSATALKRGGPIKRKSAMKRVYAAPSYEQKLAAVEKKKANAPKRPKRDKKPVDGHFGVRVATNASRMKRVEFRDTKANARRAKEAVQRDLVRSRSGGRCEFERFVDVDGYALDFAWTRCGRSGGETAHIYRRRLCGSEKYHEFVAIDGCGECHRLFDSRLAKMTVRVPIAYRRRAYKHIRRMTTSAPKTKDLLAA